MECNGTLEEDYLLNNFGTNTEDIMENLLSSNMKHSIDKLLGILRDAVRVRIEKQPGFCKNCVRSVTGCVNCDAKVPSSCEKTLSENKNESIHKFCKHSKVGILFSGGLDSTILASLAHEFLPLDEPIDLLNVAFEKPKKKMVLQGKNAKKVSSVEHSENNYLVPDRLTGRKALENLKRLFPDRVWNFLEVRLNTLKCV